MFINSYPTVLISDRVRGSDGIVRKAKKYLRCAEM